MSQPEITPVPPVALTLRPDVGRLEGGNGRCEEFLTDLDGLYRDADAYRERLAADDGRPVYWVETTQDEDGPGGLIKGILERAGGMRSLVVADGDGYRVEENPKHCGYAAAARP